VGVCASADTLTGKAVKITDGDTIYVLDGNYQPHEPPIGDIQILDVVRATIGIQHRRLGIIAKAAGARLQVGRG